VDLDQVEISMATPALMDGDRQLVGTYRRFGESGPVYEILAIRTEGKAKLVEVELPESGEKAIVKLEDVLSDPKAE
jgi:hypothetical protein